MNSSLERVLIEVDVSEPASVSRTFIEELPLEDAVFLGYWEIPDQSSSNQHRKQFGEEAEERLQDVVDRFTEPGTEPETHISFTKDKDRLINEAVNKYGCQSVLTLGKEFEPKTGPTRGVVLVKQDGDLERIAETVAELFADRDVEILLFHDIETGNEHLYDATEYMLRGLADHLSELGIERDRIEWEQSTESPRLDVIMSRVGEFDFVVLSETEPSVRERVFGSVQSALDNRTDKPLLTVRTSV